MAGWGLQITRGAVSLTCAAVVACAGVTVAQAGPDAARMYPLNAPRCVEGVPVQDWEYTNTYQYAGATLTDSVAKGWHGALVLRGDVATVDWYDLPRVQVGAASDQTPATGTVTLPVPEGPFSVFPWDNVGNFEGARLFVGPRCAGTDPVSFTDVPVGTQFFSEIEWLARKGVSTGWGEADGSRTFRPAESVYRDAMAAFLYRLAGSPAYTPPAVSPFSDVTPTTQFYKEIAWLAEKEISTGWREADGTRTFRPWEPVNRDAMAAFIFRWVALTYSPAEWDEFGMGNGVHPDDYTEQMAASDSLQFTDVVSTTQFHLEISWLFQHGVSKGWPVDNTFRPWQPVARDAMAAFMHRVSR